ncbi:hypothetical protein TNCV_3872271 [Trichonephila clavipes]|nr:hypothetical protein TNCV_3872271 [Trichonephila clavipes]
MKVSSIFSPGDDSMRITLSGTFRLITEKNTPPFFWFTRLMLLVPQYPVFPDGCSQRDSTDCSPGVGVRLCKTAVDCLPENSSSRHISKIMSKLRSSCPPMSSCP